jgi:aerobic C4-dicarboxylate transport protein
MRHKLYLQVLIAITLGVVVGMAAPEWAVKMKILGDAFIKLIKMLIGPIIFCTVVTGVAAMENLQKAGRLAVKALGYFFVMSLVSLAIGLLVANGFEPGAGMRIDPAQLTGEKAAKYTSEAAKLESLPDFILHIIPVSLFDAFAKGEVLQVLLVALLFAAAVVLAGERARPVVTLIEQFSHLLFVIVGMVMRLAPLGAFGAMAFSVGEYGIGTLLDLLKLLGCFYITCLLFVLVILGGMMRAIGLSLFRFLRYIREELFIVLGTSSSETVFPRMIDKLNALGVEKSVTGMVLPTGYSFNLDGTMIYLTLAAVFLAQATNTPLSLGEQCLLLGVMMLTSKGAAGVVGSAFIVLTAALEALGTVPVASVALILGIDRFMAEGRSITNLIGNGVATLVIARWEKALDVEKARGVLKREAEIRCD